jgi:hypothetical protein
VGTNIGRSRRTTADYETNIGRTVKIKNVASAEFERNGWSRA